MAELGLDKPATAEPDHLMDVYLRRSNKKEDLAVLRAHLRDISRWARNNHLQIRHVWFEQLSASKSYVRRAEFEKCTKAILDGKSKTMGIWKTDRFDRRGMGAVGRMLDEFEDRRARLVSIIEGLDSSQPGVRTIFAMLSERARDEAKDIALRVKTGHDAHKAENRRGTGRPPFGTMSPRLPNGKPSGRIEPDPNEFPTARRLADLLLGEARDLPDEWKHKEGTPLTTKDVAHILNVEERRTRGGHTWSPTAVSKLVQSPLFAGMVPVRERRTDEHGNPLGSWRGYGEPMLDDQGNPRICGTGVITVAEYYKIRSYIRERTNDRFGKGKPGVKYLGTSLYKCGRIRVLDDGTEGLCMGSQGQRGGMYRCQVRVTRGVSVCKGSTTLSSRVDHAVGQAWIRHVTALDPEDPVLITIGRRWLAFSDPETQAKKEHARQALEAAQRRVKKLEEDYYLFGKLSEERYEELSSQQRATIEAMVATLEAMDAETDLSPLLDATSLREAWEDADVPTRRMLLKCTLGSKGIIIYPAKRRGDKSPILERLEFDWISK
ncbi:recombinase family protein [Allostreptomyces psammosilenae]|uniref:DNA invertase Pin-like site-specific DNA recombinase n=1 Tax=Allostreptomyces psammosilenae TaxID=1892865 RepID=A0A852ZUJ4_9ACTN|nr:recombinase family protein [Allostreptomyces psammosilenae]NYI06056.1 DNA invertase Pin-like site-specific DNA recombinase [Allostreptomyces psammosilenae]